MEFKIKSKDFRVKDKKDLSLADYPTRIDPIYEDKKDYSQLLKAYKKDLFELQNMMYAHNKYACLCIFQAIGALARHAASR